MSKDRVVAFRLNEHLYQRLERRCGERKLSVLMRQLVAAELDPAPDIGWRPESQSLTCVQQPNVVWHDGTAGQTWPAPMTG